MRGGTEGALPACPPVLTDRWVSPSWPPCLGGGGPAAAVYLPVCVVSAVCAVGVGREVAAFLGGGVAFHDATAAAADTP